MQPHTIDLGVGGGNQNEVVIPLAVPLKRCLIHAEFGTLSLGGIGVRFIALPRPDRLGLVMK